MSAKLLVAVYDADGGAAIRKPACAADATGEEGSSGSPYRCACPSPPAARVRDLVGPRHGLDDEHAVDGPVAENLPRGIDMPDHPIASRHSGRGRCRPRLDVPTLSQTRLRYSASTRTQENFFRLQLEHDGSFASAICAGRAHFAGTCR